MNVFGKNGIIRFQVGNCVIVSFWETFISPTRAVGTPDVNQIAVFVLFFSFSFSIKINVFFLEFTHVLQPMFPWKLGWIAVFILFYIKEIQIRYSNLLDFGLASCLSSYVALSLTHMKQWIVKKNERSFIYNFSEFEAGHPSKLSTGHASLNWAMLVLATR